MRCPKRLGSQVPGLTAANSPAKFFERRTATPEEFVPPVVGVLGVLFEISIVCLFLCVLFVWFLLGVFWACFLWVCLGCAWLVLFVWVVLVPGGLVCSLGFVVLPG